MTYKELLHLAQERELSREQVIELLAIFLDSNEEYIARRRRRRKPPTQTDDLLDAVQPALALAIYLLHEEASQK